MKPLTFALVVCFAQMLSSHVLGQEAPCNYARVNEPVAKPAFIPLPLNAIKADGWIHNWNTHVRNTLLKTYMTKKFETYGKSLGAHDIFQQHWAMALTPDNVGKDAPIWYFTTSAYFLNGCYRLALANDDRELLDFCEKHMRFVVETAKKHGAIIPPDPRWLPLLRGENVKNEKGGRDTDFNYFTWCVAQMALTLVDWYPVCKDKDIISAFNSTYIPFVYDKPQSRYRWANIEPMIEAYSYGADKKVLDNALKEMEVYGKKEFAIDAHLGGGLLSKYQYMPAYLYSGKKEYLQKMLDLDDRLNKGFMMPYGIPSGNEAARGIGDQVGTETCDVYYYIWFKSWMLRALGDGVHGDQMEKAYFNAAPAAFSRNGDGHVYHQSPNRLKGDKTSGQYSYSQSHGPLCCSSATAYVLANYIGSMWMATYDNGLAFTLYGPCSLSALAGNKTPVKIRCATSYPFDEKISIKVTPEKADEFPLYFRIPQWCKSPQITLNGKAVEIKTDAHGFVKIGRTWNSGDTVELTFPMTTEITLAKTIDPDRDDAWIIPDLPYATVTRGPVLYSLRLPEGKSAAKGAKEGDTSPNICADMNAYKYALIANLKDVAGSFKFTRNTVPETWGWQADAPVSLTGKGLFFDWKERTVVDKVGIDKNYEDAGSKQKDSQPFLPDAPVPDKDGQVRDITLVPYGCTQLRVTMFPYTESTANSAK